MRCQQGLEKESLIPHIFYAERLLPEKISLETMISMHLKKALFFIYFFSRPIHVPEEALKEAAEKAASAASQDKSLAKDKSDVVDGQGEPMEEDDEDMVLVQKAEEFNSGKDWCYIRTI